MSKPSDIPQDVWDAASELLYAVEAMPSDGNIAVIARAILAAKAEEREACAREAERDGSSHDATFSQQTPEWRHDTTVAVRTADRIAAAIRNRGEA